MRRNPVLSIQGLNKSFDDLHVLKNVDMEIYSGDTVAIIGSSGSGKSTLLRCISNLEQADKGSIVLAGTSIDALRCDRTRSQKVGMVFQHFNLFPHYSVVENIYKPLVAVQKMPKDEAIKIANQLLEKVRLMDKTSAFPHQLSGGQQQRVAIARALAMKPEIMLFDEPTSALDPELKGEVLQTIRDLTREGITMIVVTHEMEFARQVADRVVYMDEGKVIEEGETETFFMSPQNERTVQFLNKSS